MDSINAEKHYSYQFGGLIIESSMRIGALLSATEEAVSSNDSSRISIQISDRPLLSAGALVYTWGGRYELSLWKLPDAWIFRTPAGAEFVADLEGSTIKCFTGPGGWSD